MPTCANPTTGHIIITIKILMTAVSVDFTSGFLAISFFVTS
jgi:hypothetical protein